jgi:O-antigen/teichoic acid export membrane protein
MYGLEEFKITSVRDILIKVVTAICIFAFVRSEDDVWKYALIYSVGFFISQIVVMLIIYRRIYFIKPQIHEIALHIKPNLVLFLPTVAVSFYKTMDKILLGLLSSEEELGYYHSSENIIKVPLALITALGTVMLPRMSNMLSVGVKKQQVENLFDKSLKFALFISSSICFGIMTVAKEFVPLFFGRGFERCVGLFYVILPSCIFVAFANVIRTQYLLPRKKDKIFVVSLFMGAIINVFLDIILISEHGAMGAALGTFAAEAFVCVFQAVSVYEEANIGRNILNTLPYVFSGIVMFFLFMDYKPFISNSILALMIKIFVSGMFYLITLSVIVGFMKKYIKRKH